MRFVAVVFFVLGLLALNAAHTSQQWQRFKNEHGCQIIPRKADQPRAYVCAGQRCESPTDCRNTITKEPTL